MSVITIKVIKNQNLLNLIWKQKMNNNPKKFWVLVATNFRRSEVWAFFFCLCDGRLISRFSTHFLTSLTLNLFSLLPEKTNERLQRNQQLNNLPVFSKAPQRNLVLVKLYQLKEILLDSLDGQNMYFSKDKSEFYNKDSRFHLL